MFFPKVRVYRIEFYETECMCFMIKEEIVFDIYMETWETVNNIIKKINSELMYSKKYIIAKRTFNTKESLQSFYRKVIPVPVILIDLSIEIMKTIILKCF